MNGLEPEIDLSEYLSKTEYEEISSSLDTRLTSVENDYLSKSEGGEISASLSVLDYLHAINMANIGNNIVSG
jgi:hypothetical protein